MSQNIAQPSNPAIATTGQIMDALCDFVLAYGSPAGTVPLPGDNIYFANQNRESLPPESEEYATIYIGNGVRHGTAVEVCIPGVDDAPDKLGLASLFEYMVQIDIYSWTQAARERAMTLANLGRSSIGPQHFNNYKCSLLYVDDPRDMTGVGDAQQYVQRYMLTLRVTITELTTVDLEAFDTVKITRLENVEVHHKI